MTNDQFLTNPPPYQIGPFGNYYMAPGTVLASAGSTSATNLGLYYYTTTTNQALQGDALVDIGLHYVAASSNANGWGPLETNGIPDYIADVNGTGVIPSGAANAYSDYYTNIDLAGDGMVGLVKSNLNNLNPLVFNNPLILTQKVTGQEPAIVTLEVGVNHTLVESHGQLVLMVDGIPVTTDQSSQVALNGNCLLIWNTTNYAPGQTHSLQAHLVLSPSGVSADGPLIAFNQPIVIIQPSDQTNGLGGTVTFTAFATGPGIYTYTYQWQLNSNNIQEPPTALINHQPCGDKWGQLHRSSGKRRWRPNYKFQCRSHCGGYESCNYITAVEPASDGGGRSYFGNFGLWNGVPVLPMANVGSDDFQHMDQPSRRDQQHIDHAQL